VHWSLGDERRVGTFSNRQRRRKRARLGNDTGLTSRGGSSKKLGESTGQSGPEIPSDVKLSGGGPVVVGKALGKIAL